MSDASVRLHWAAHLIEKSDPAIGGLLRRTADLLHGLAKRLRRRHCG